MSKHYIAPVAPEDRLPSEGETLFSRAERGDYIVDAQGCWIWQKATLNGYPISGGTAGTSARVHRLYWERANGPLPDGHDVHHTCGETLCINPGHLEALHWRDHDLLHFLHERGLSLETVMAVREEGRKPGSSTRKVAAEYGVSRETVRRWWNSTTWADFIGDGPIVRPHRICVLTGCEDRTVGRSTYCSADHRDIARAA